MVFFDFFQKSYSDSGGPNSTIAVLHMCVVPNLGMQAGRAPRACAPISVGVAA